jgi:hypothetical protein
MPDSSWPVRESAAGSSAKLCELVIEEVRGHDDAHMIVPCAQLDRDLFCNC